jgi:hypothetical protein
VHDVTLSNPLSPPVRGWEQVAATAERTAEPFRDGEFASVEIIDRYVTHELAYVVEIVWDETKIGASEEITP